MYNRTPLVDPDEGEEALQHLEPAPGVEVPLRVVAVPGMAPRNQHTFGPGKQGLDHEEGIHPPRQGTRMIRRSVGCLNRPTPAVSAPP